MTPKTQHSLDALQVASPCSQNWDEMTGDDRARHCGQCDLHVYNLAELSRREAEKLIFETEGRVCVRFYRREDGTVLTRDCPVGVRAIRQRVLKVAGLVAAILVGFLSPLSVFAADAKKAKSSAACSASQPPSTPTAGVPVTSHQTWQGQTVAPPPTMGRTALPHDPGMMGELMPPKPPKTPDSPSSP